MPRVSAFYGIVIAMYSEEGVHGGPRTSISPTSSSTTESSVCPDTLYRRTQEAAGVAA